jgi:hypothetical protein
MKRITMAAKPATPATTSRTALSEIGGFLRWLVTGKLR